MSIDYDSIIRMLRANPVGPGNTVAGERVSPLEYLCSEYFSYSDELFHSENKELLETVIRALWHRTKCIESPQGRAMCRVRAIYPLCVC